MLFPRRKWKDITDYEGIYQVSNLGEVRSLNYRGTGKTRIIKQDTGRRGERKVRLYKNNKYKNFQVHRLVAIHFIPNPNKLPQVNHKDENTSNNLWTNLEWCTSKYNCNYGTRNRRIGNASKSRMHSEETRKRISKSNKGNKSRCIKIKCITTGETFNSIKEASNYYEVAHSSIGKCCRGERKHAGKDKITGEPLKWKYIN